MLNANGFVSMSRVMYSKSQFDESSVNDFSPYFNQQITIPFLGTSNKFFTMKKHKS